ncbi:HAD family hydrolase [Fusibacter sp. 3D3]|uniref:HAD family hydrolase n=1 Tax=Fusibacter sp. 3D3 TaxID=1048380 RepID=UPI000853456E|nr:HAD-IA family hydrolase [Fusibacter sp. 3D3]GAU76614.1 haloacid dehalogenase-like hydrolase [Fusibacter sp. 3D3]
MKYKNIIFDVDGTLINTTAANLLSLQEILLLEGKSNFTLEDLAHFDGLPGLYVLEQLSVDNIKEKHRQWLELTSHRKYMFEIYYGIHATLKILKTAGANLAIVTSRNMEEITSDPKLDQLSPYFDILVSSDHTTKHKPNPEPLLYALEQGRYNIEDTLYVGDSIYDFQAACAAQLVFAKASWGLKSFDIRVQDYALKEPMSLLNIL